MSSNTSVGRGPAAGGNENHDGDPLSKTLGEKVKQEPPAGSDTGEETLLDDAAPEVPAGVAGARPRPGVARAADAYPDGPNVEASPWELDAARGKLPK